MDYLKQAREFASAHSVEAASQFALISIAESLRELCDANPDVRESRRIAQVARDMADEIRQRRG